MRGSRNSATGPPSALAGPTKTTNESGGNTRSELMSHFTRVKTRIVDMLYLKRALGELNLQHKEGKVKIRGYMGKKMEVELRISTPDGYDIGFRKAGDTYEVVADWDMIKSISQESFIAEVTRRYATEVVKEQLKIDNYTLVEETKQGNELHLTMRRS
ncbi:DUF1257 domain-containing protein [bacterium]|nr:MAG: DUF1257 domain-containing protein [bacterium]